MKWKLLYCSVCGYGHPYDLDEDELDKSSKEKPYILKCPCCKQEWGIVKIGEHIYSALVRLM